MSIQMQATKPLPHLGAAVGDLYTVPTEADAKRHEYAGRGKRYTPPKEAGKAPSQTKPAGPSRVKPEAPSEDKDEPNHVERKMAFLLDGLSKREREDSKGWFDVVDGSGRVVSDKALRKADADAFINERTDA